MKHGHASGEKPSLTYASWVKMRHKPDNQAAGIPPAWVKFETFLAEMGERPTAKHGLRRIDKELPYSKENCRWATHAETVKVKHGESGTALYRVWKAAKRRCNDPKQVNYCGRGIKMAPEWEADFLAFKAEVGDRPTPSHTLERMNNDLGYEPGNVRWATRLEQANNLRKNVLLTIDSRTQTVAQWAREKGVPYSTMYRGKTTV